MRLNYTLSFLIVGMLSFLNANAQSGQIGTNVQDHLLILTSNKNLKKNPGEEIEGTPYLKDEFVPGVVYGLNNKHVGIPLRYNIYMDHIEFRQNEQIYILDPEPRIHKVGLENTTFMVAKFEFKGKLKYGYLTLLDSGKITLMSKKIVIYTQGHAPKALEAAATPSKYSRGGDVFFYQIGNGEIIKVDNIKKFIANLPDKQKELSEFAQTEKISAKKEADLIKFVKYYNSL